MADMMRRGTGTLWVVVSIVVFLATEITVLILVASALKWWTLALLIGTMVLGGWLLQREGRKAWQAMVRALASGSLPAGQTTDAVLILIGGLLLMMPGFVSDVVALLLLIRPTRHLCRLVLGRLFGRTLSSMQTHPTIIEGEVITPAEEPGPDDTWIPQISPKTP